MEPIMVKPIIGKRYLWSKQEDTVLVKDIEKDIVFAEVISCDDKKYKVGQKMWVFIEDLKI